MSIPGLDINPGPSREEGSAFDIFAEINFDFPTDDQMYGNCRRQEEFVIKETIQLFSSIRFCKATDLKKDCKVTLISHECTQDSDDELTDILSEVEFIRQLKNENILQFYETVLGKNPQDVVFVYEPSSFILSKMIEEKGNKLCREDVIKNIMKQLFTALDYLHDNSIMHRDIHPENILFSSDGVLKIYNFRNARRFGQKQGKIKTLEYRYKPIELLIDSRTCDESVDIWAANCVLAHLLLKQPLFANRERENVIRDIFSVLGFPTRELLKDFHESPEYGYLFAVHNIFNRYNSLRKHFQRNCFIYVTDHAMDLLQRNFVFDPKRRLTAEESLKHPYFKQAPSACDNQDLLKLLDNCSGSSTGSQLLQKIKEEPK